MLLAPPMECGESPADDGDSLVGCMAAIVAIRAAERRGGLQGTWAGEEGEGMNVHKPNDDCAAGIR